MNAKLKTDALDLTSLLNGLVFFSPVSLLVRTTAGISLSQFFILQAIMATMVLLTEIPLGKPIALAINPRWYYTRSRCSFREPASCWLM